MSLDNIQLPSFIIPDLFRKSLIEPNSTQSKIPESNSANINYLGGNKQNIVLIFRNTEAAYLTDVQMKFLTGILDACKLNMDDVALVNLKKTPGINYQQITEALQARNILLFDVSPSEMGLPFNIPEFQKQSYNNQSYLIAPSLDKLESDKELKRKLWVCLKQIFSL